MKRPRKKPKTKTQTQKFIEAAHRFEADMDEETFKRSLEQIAKAKLKGNTKRQ